MFVHPPPHPPHFPVINYWHNAMKDEKPDQHLLIPFLIGARQGFLLGRWLVSGLWGILLHLNVLGLTLIFWLGTVRVTCQCHKTNEKFHLEVQTRTQTIIGGNCHKYYFSRDKSFVVTNTCLPKTMPTLNPSPPPLLLSDIFGHNSPPPPPPPPPPPHTHTKEKKKRSYTIAQ